MSPGSNEPLSGGRRIEVSRRAPAAAIEEQVAGVLDLSWSQEGFAWLEVEGWSMFPTSVAGGRQRVAPRREAPALGQVVVFARGPRLVAHRLVARTAEGLLTKGDGVAACDPPLAEAQILGVVELAQLGPARWRVRVDPRVARLSLRLGQAHERALVWLPPSLRRAVYLLVATPVLCLAKVLSWQRGGQGEP